MKYENRKLACYYRVCTFTKSKKYFFNMILSFIYTTTAFYLFLKLFIFKNYTFIALGYVCMEMENFPFLVHRRYANITLMPFKNNTNYFMASKKHF